MVELGRTQSSGGRVSRAWRTGAEAAPLLEAIVGGVRHVMSSGMSAEFQMQRTNHKMVSISELQLLCGCGRAAQL